LANSATDQGSTTVVKDYTHRLAGLLMPVCLSILATGTRPARAEAPQCTPAAAQAAAPTGMTIGPIGDASPALPAGFTGAMSVPAANGTAGYCLITGTVVTNPQTGKTANFATVLPDSWNGKFLFQGCGGLCGITMASGPGEAINKGYAISATDDGHAANPTLAFDGSWAITAPGVPNEDAVVDFYYRAVHTVATVNKTFVMNWYQGALQRSYFSGCSDGGREGMVEASRFPADFDGVIAGDPFFDVPGETLGGYKDAKALLRSPGAYVPPNLLALVDKAIYKTCDAADGVEDGLIQNPAACSFDPRTLLCEQGQSTECLTKEQADTITSYFASVRDPLDRVLYQGYPSSDLYDNGLFGSNMWLWMEAVGPAHDIHAAEPWDNLAPPAWQLADTVLRYLVASNADFDSNNDFPMSANDVVGVDGVAALFDRTDAGSGDVPQALRPFVRQNRKLIMYHGFSDGWITPYRTVQFYEDWAQQRGGYNRLQQNARLFMVPGMYHCVGGPGPNTFDTLTALENWVENDVAPEAIVATKYVDDDPTKSATRTMPLCKFPEQAEYGGSDVNQAASWHCSANQKLLEVGADGLLAGLHPAEH
jgi:feruloyl esterase